MAMKPIPVVTIMIGPTKKPAHPAITAAVQKTSIFTVHSNAHHLCRLSV